MNIVKKKIYILYGFFPIGDVQCDDDDIKLSRELVFDRYNGALDFSGHLFIRNYAELRFSA